jgi:hypothetical protein
MKTNKVTFSQFGMVLMILFVGLVLVSTGCKKKEGCMSTTATNYDPDAEKDDGSCIEPTVIVTPPTLNVPSTYEFTRNGATSVSYGGQTDRLNQLEELKAKMNLADGGSVISSADLLDMFANTGDNGGGNFSFTSTKQLKDKTFELDTAWFVSMLTAAADASDSGFAGVVGVDGTAGLVTRSNGNTILVSENGFEFTQIVEKGLMGACFLNQIFNSYLTDTKIGSTVDNTTVGSGNYTPMEHHWDEAYGYFDAPVDFASSYTGTATKRFWTKYCNTVDGTSGIGFSDAVMLAFRTGRAAIVANDEASKNAQRDVLYAQLEKVAAATAIHYVNESLSKTNDGDRLHALSELYAFTKALRYGNTSYRQVTIAEVDVMLDTDIGTNLWQTTTTGLNTLKDKLATAYGLESVKDIL